MNPSFTDTRLVFNWARPPVPSIININYFTIQAIGKSECGAAGVVFVENDEGSFCVKACTESVAVEYFSHLLFQLNKIDVPNIFLIPCTSYHWNVIKNTIELATFQDEVVRRSIKSKLQSPMLLLMEYVPNLSVTYMGPQKAEKIFSGIDEISIDRLINLGRIFAMDTVINNSDRYPVLWENNGNPENLLLKVKTLEKTTTKELRNPLNFDLGFINFVAIDNRVNLLDRNCKYSLPNLVKYEENLNLFVKELVIYLDQIRETSENCCDLMKILEQNKFPQFSKFKNLRKFIKKYSYYEITPSSEFLIAMGLLICYENLTRNRISRIENLLETLKKTSKKWTDVDFIWEESLNHINLDFISGIFSIIEENLKGFEKTITWIHELTGRRFFIDEKEAFDPQILINKSLKVDESPEDIQKYKKIAGETGEEIENIKKKRRMEEQKEMNERKLKIKEIKIKRQKKAEELKELMERNFKEMKAANEKNK